MAETKWTEGDWTANIALGCVVVPTDNTYSKVVADTTYETSRATCRLTDQEIEANTHLIAAAPDLYAALQTLIDIEDGPGMGVMGWDNAMQAAKDALAKARGESPAGALANK